MTAKKSVKKGNSSKNTMTIVVRVAVALLIIAAIVCGLGWASQKDGKWFHESDMAKWCNSWGKGSTAAESSTQPQLIALTDEGEELLSGGTYAMPKAMTIVSDVSAADSQFAADGEFTITASVDNEYMNGMFDFVVYFSEEFDKTEYSEWADGKYASDYIEITPISWNSATLKLLAPFGAPIEIKATLTGTDSYATCRVDYLQRIESNWISFSNCDFQDAFTVDFKFDYGIGTVKGEFELTSASVYIKDAFISEMERFLNFDVTFKSFQFSSSSSTSVSSNNTFEVEVAEFGYGDFISDFDDLDEQHREAIYYAWYTAWYTAWRNSQDYNNALITFAVKYSYHGIYAGGWVESDYLLGYIPGEQYGNGVSPDVELNGNVTL